MIKILTRSIWIISRMVITILQTYFIFDLLHEIYNIESPPFQQYPNFSLGNVPMKLPHMRELGTKPVPNLKDDPNLTLIVQIE